MRAQGPIYILIEDISGRRLMERVADEIDSIGVGRMEIVTVQGNNSKVW